MTAPQVKEMPQSPRASLAAKHRRTRAAAPVVCLDADNTLWDTDGVFAAAQLELLKRVEMALGHNAAVADRLSYVREVDQELASRHHLGLRYPPHLLVSALSHRLLGDEVAMAARKAWKDPTSNPLTREATTEIENDYVSNLRVTPMLLPGVDKGLERMHRASVGLVLVTEGGRSRVELLLEANKISHYIDRVIDAPKRKELFARLRRLFPPEVDVYMIGDQLTRDVLPALDAGLKAIHIQGKFRPFWEVGAVAPAAIDVATFDDAAAAVLSDT